MKIKTNKQKHKKKDSIKIIVFLVLSIFLMSSVGFVSQKVAVQAKELEQIKQEFNIVQEDKVNSEALVKELQTRKEVFEKEITELKKNLQELKKNNATLPMQVEEREEKYAYLTFDDGPSINTLKILEFLKANNIKATFFVLGNEKKTDIYKRIVDEGHTIAIHSNTHEYEDIYRSPENFMKDINTLSKLIEDSTGIKPTIMRFPGGSNNTISKKYGGSRIMEQVIPEVEKAGLMYFDWNVDSRDAAKSKQDTQVIVDSVLNGAKSLRSKEGVTNAVILMHDAAAKTTTVEALPAIVEGLRKQGFTFKELTTETQPIHFR